LVWAGLAIETLRDRGAPVHVTRVEWSVAAASAAALLGVFMADAGVVGRGGMPRAFPWPWFLVFLGIGGLAALRAWRRSRAAAPVSRR
jgi:hypothetical protein